MNEKAAVVDGFEIEYETDPNAHNRVEPEDRGPGMDSPVHYTYATPAEKPRDRDVRVHEAVRAGDRERVRALVLDLGLDVHQRAEQDWTPLHVAAGRGDLAMVRLLVEELDADITAVGRDRRRPLAIARAAARDEVAAYLAAREKEQHVDRASPALRPYCKAYHLRELKKFAGFRELEKANDDDVVFLHHDLQVTRSMWHGEEVIFQSNAPEWARFCADELAFAIKESS
jgi:hypothetical protein